MTHDQIAAGYLLAGKPIPKALVRDAAAAVGAECPQCGSRNTEDNGSTEHRCVECDARWGFDLGERYGL